MGIQKKIIFGFFILTLLLVFAGLISMAELARMRNQADKIIAYNNGITRSAKDMQKALDEQNSSVLRMVLSNGEHLDSAFNAALKDFDNTLAELNTMTGSKVDLNSIRIASGQYCDIVSARISELSLYVFREESAEFHKEWFFNTYLPVYYDFDTAIKDFISSPHTSVKEETEALVNSALRTFTPTIITLVVAIIIVVIFCCFINIYYVKPILNINKALKKYINNKTPYNVSIEKSGDEISSLNTMITDLVDKDKKHG